MDLATVIGILTGLGLIVGAILLDSTLGAYFNAPGLLVVFGGTLAATLINQKFKYVLGAFSVAMNAFFDKCTSADEIVEASHELVQTARKDGVLGLENVQVRDPFLARGVLLAIDGLEVDFIVSTMRRELAALERRHQRGQQIFRFMAATSPAMGMIGTLIGLVQMLQTLDDPSSIGPSMAVALLTTMYGAIVAFFVCGPIAEKLANRTIEEAANMKVVVEGIDSIVKGHNAAVIKDKLEARIEPTKRAPSDEEADAA